MPGQCASNTVPPKLWHRLIFPSLPFPATRPPSDCPSHRHKRLPFTITQLGRNPCWPACNSKLQGIWSTGDTSWKLLCGAVDVGMLTGLPHITSQYKGKWVHVNTVCARLQPLFWFLQNFLLNFWQHSSSFLTLDTLPICSLTSLSLEELSVSILQRQMRKAFRSGFPNEEKPVETTALQRPRV